MSDIRLLRRRAVEAIVGLKKTRINALERAGKFPRAVRVSDRVVAYRSDEIQAWIESRPLAADVAPDVGGQVHTRRS